MTAKLSMTRWITFACVTRWRWIARLGTFTALLTLAFTAILPQRWESTAVLLPADRRADDFQYRAGRAGIQRLLESFRRVNRSHPQEIDHAVLSSDSTRRALVERLDLQARWNLPQQEAATRVERSLRYEDVPYGPLLLHATTEDRQLSALLANEAASILVERLKLLKVESVRGERDFVTAALRDEIADATAASAELADYETRLGLAEPKALEAAAAAWALDREMNVVRARLDHAEALRIHGAGSSSERETAQKLEGLLASEASLPKSSGAGILHEVKRGDVRRAERMTRLLGALRGQTLSGSAARTFEARVLDPAIPARLPVLFPYVLGATLAFSAFPLIALVDRAVGRRALAVPDGVLVLGVAASATLLGHSPLALAVLLCVSFFALLIAHMQWGWFLLMTVLPWAWDYVDIQRGFVLQIPTEPGMILLVLAWAYALVLRGNFQLPRSRIFQGALLVIAWMALTAIPSVYPKYSIFQIVSVTGFILVGALFPLFEIRDLAQVRRFLLATVFSGTLCAIYGLVQVIASPLSFERAAIAIGAPLLYDHSIFAAYLSFAFAIAFTFHAMRPPRERDPWTLPALALLLCGIVVSLTRAAWVSVVGLMLVAGLFASRISWRAVAPAVASIGGVVGVLLLSPVLSGQFRAYIERGISPEYTSNVERMNRWSAAVAMVIDRPLTGVGPGAYERAYPNYRRAEFASVQSGDYMGSHSELFRSASEQGWVGLVLFLCLVAWTLQTGLRLIRHSGNPEIRLYASALTAALVTYAFHGLFNEFYRVPKIALNLWAYAGLLGALAQIERAACLTNNSLDTLGSPVPHPPREKK